MKIAIITGASSGIGREFALEIARRGEVDEIWAVARRESRLQELKSVIGESVVPFVLDLTKTEDADKLAAALKAKNATVRYLVNAAGFGKFGDYTQVERRDYLGMIDLNVRALTDLTYLTLPYMQAGSRIIQMCSFSAYMPLENFAVYAASKAFVLSHSYGLRRELIPRKISVTAVCPGWVRTEFFDTAEQNPEAKGPKKKQHFTTAAKVVKKALRAAKKNKPAVITGAYLNAMHALTKVVPRRTIAYIWHTMQK